jgi:xanthine dehydrogenase iron-sulfur cluster and FAD-binding subunit A
MVVLAHSAVFRGPGEHDPARAGQDVCLQLTVAAQGREILTIEGVAGPDGDLHPMQQAFLDHHGLQCGYCTPGQICSAIGALAEAGRGWPGYVTADVEAGVEAAAALDAEEIRECLSGNLCIAAPSCSRPAGTGCDPRPPSMAAASRLRL